MTIGAALLFTDPKSDFPARAGIEIRVLGRRGRGDTDVPASTLSTSIRASVAYIPTRTPLSLPLSPIDSNSRAPLESFPGAAWPRMPGKLAPVPRSITQRYHALATRVQPEWPSIFNASAPLLGQIPRRIVQLSVDTFSIGERESNIRRVNLKNRRQSPPPKSIERRIHRGDHAYTREMERFVDSGGVVFGVPLSTAAIVFSFPSLFPSPGGRHIPVGRISPRERAPDDRS